MNMRWEGELRKGPGCKPVRSKPKLYWKSRFPSALSYASGTTLQVPIPKPTIAQQHDETDGSQHGCADQKCRSGAAHSSYGVRTAGDLGVAPPATDMWGLSHAGGTGAPQPHCPILSHSPSHLGTATSARRAGTMLGHGRDTWPCSGKGQGPSWGTAGGQPPTHDAVSGVLGSSAAPQP